MIDVVIVGGGPAGLNAALVLGRCRRKVLLCDVGRPRNARAQALHGFLTRDGTPPLDLLALGREELRHYGIERHESTVIGIAPAPEGFDVTLESGQRVAARTVLIASGIRDDLPGIPGLEDCYGTTVHHCPYCDGWEHRDQELAVLGQGNSAAGLALSLKSWSASVAICSNGGARLRPAQRQQLATHGIAVHEGRIARVEHDEGRVQRIVLASGAEIPCGAIFCNTRQRPQSDLPRQLGCELTRRGLVKTDHLGQTCVPGVYVAGDASRDVQFAIVAAAEGAKAAVAINKALQARAGLAVA